jgi:hypothetical protein
MARVEWIKGTLPAERGRVFVKFRDEQKRIRVATAFWNGQTFTCGAAPEGTPVLAWRPMPDKPEGKR